MAVSAQGGRPHEIARPDCASGRGVPCHPSCCPAAARSCSRFTRAMASRLAAMDLRTGAITRFDQPGFGPQWVDGGFVVLGNADGTLIALPFDPEGVRATGPPVTIARDVLAAGTPIPRGPRCRRADRSFIRGPAGVSRGELVLVSRSGQATPLTPDPRTSRARASPPTAGGSRSASRTRPVRPRRVGARCRPARVVAPHDRRHQQSPDLDAGRPARGVLEQRRSVVDRGRRQRASG